MLESVNLSQFLAGVATGLQIAWLMWRSTGSPNADIQLFIPIRDNQVVAKSIKPSCQVIAGEAKPKDLEALEN